MQILHFEQNCKFCSFFLRMTFPSLCVSGNSFFATGQKQNSCTVYRRGKGRILHNLLQELLLRGTILLSTVEGERGKNAHYVKSQASRKESLIVLKIAKGEREREANTQRSINDNYAGRHHHNTAPLLGSGLVFSNDIHSFRGKSQIIYMADLGYEVRKRERLKTSFSHRAT